MTFYAEMTLLNSLEITTVNLVRTLAPSALVRFMIFSHDLDGGCVSPLAWNSLSVPILAQDR